MSRLYLDCRVRRAVYRVHCNTHQHLLRYVFCVESRPRALISPPQNKAALERMEEMRQLIGKRSVVETSAPRPRPLSYAAPQTPTTSRGLTQGDELVHFIENATSEADKALVRASSSQDALGADLGELVVDIREKTAQLAKTRAELQSQKRQRELIKSLLDSAVAENALVYDVRLSSLIYCYASSSPCRLSTRNSQSSSGVPSCPRRTRGQP